MQGLELDWVCMTWDADLRFAQSDWSYNSFRGDKWTTVHKADRRQYPQECLPSAAHAGAAGNGDLRAAWGSSDATRAPDYYDSTFAYLDAGCPYD